MGKHIPAPLGREGTQLIDASQVRAMLAYQQQLMQEQLMAQEMAMLQQQQQLQQQLLQLQQLHHAAHLDADDVRKAISSLNPGESFKVKLYQGFEVHHTKPRMNGAQVLVALILVAIILGLAAS